MNFRKKGVKIIDGVVIVGIAISMVFGMTFILQPASSQAYGIPYISPPAKYFNSDIVLIGKVISSVPFSPDYTKYQIKVEQYLKNPQSQDTLTVIAPGTNTTTTADTVFDVGQQAFLYLKKDQENYTVWWYSYPTDSLCDPAPTAADLNFTYPQGVGLDYNPLQVGASKSSSYLYAVNQPVVIKYNAWNNQFTTKTFDIVFQVKNQAGQIIFNDTKQVELAPCIGHQIVNSTFIPKVAGTYEVDVIFNNSLTGTTVEIPPSVVNTISNVGYVSPLKQFKSGVAANNIVCRDDLQLLIEKQEGFPICVTLYTASQLSLQDWSYPSNCKYDQNPFTAGVEGLIVIEKNASDLSSDKSYSPRNSTVVIGWNNTVSWINQDDAYSSVTSDNHLFDSGSIKPGDTWQHSFECLGTYRYHSEPHPWMLGVIRVLLH